SCSALRSSVIPISSTCYLAAAASSRTSIWFSRSWSTLRKTSDEPSPTVHSAKKKPAKCLDRSRRVRPRSSSRSEEHTSELQSRENLVCRLLLEKKNKI